MCRSRAISASGPLDHRTRRERRVGVEPQLPLVGAGVLALIEEGEAGGNAAPFLLVYPNTKVRCCRVTEVWSNDVADGTRKSLAWNC